MTVTGRVWCLRQARAMRCSSLAGFQGRSQLMTTLAFWRFRPAAPESVLRKTRQCGSDLKALISARRRFWGTVPVCQAKPSLSRSAQLARQFEHPLPFGEDDDLDVGVVAAFFEELLQFRQLRAGAVLGIEDVVGVADHAHHGQMAQQLVLFLLRERAAFGDAGQLGDDALVVVVFALLLGAERDEVVAVGALGQFGFHVGFAPAEHVGLDALVELVEVAVAGGAAAVVQVVILAVEAEQRAEQRTG